MKPLAVNQKVRVRTELISPNRRVPSYVRGKIGAIIKVHGIIPDFQHDHADDWGPMYSVLFEVSSRGEKVSVDLHEPWLEAVG